MENIFCVVLNCSTIKDNLLNYLIIKQYFLQNWKKLSWNFALWAIKKVYHLKWLEELHINEDCPEIVEHNWKLYGNSYHSSRCNGFKWNPDKLRKLEFFTIKQIKLSEDADSRLFSALFCSPRCTNRVIYYLETGKIPIRYILAKRRLLFLWHILSRPDN